MQAQFAVLVFSHFPFCPLTTSMSSPPLPSPSDHKSPSAVSPTAEKSASATGRCLGCALGQPNRRQEGRYRESSVRRMKTQRRLASCGSFAEQGCAIYNFSSEDKARSRCVMTSWPCETSTAPPDEMNGFRLQLTNATCEAKSTAAKRDDTFSSFRVHPQDLGPLIAEEMRVNAARGGGVVNSSKLGGKNWQEAEARELALVGSLGFVVAFEMTGQAIVSFVVVSFFAALGVAYFCKILSEALVYPCKCALCCGKYELADMLGEGAYGVVFSALQFSSAHVPRRGSFISGSSHPRLPPRCVVIKKIPVHDITEAAGYVGEAQQLRSLNHPNVVAYIDEFIHQENAFLKARLNKQTFFMIVTEKCDMGDLSDVAILSRCSETPTFQQVMSWFCGIVRAVHCIHQKNILHRDIKAQNVFLATDGTVRLGDFGLCCEAPEPSSEAIVALHMPRQNFPTSWQAERNGKRSVHSSMSGVTKDKRRSTMRYRSLMPNRIRLRRRQRSKGLDELLQKEGDSSDDSFCGDASSAASGRCGDVCEVDESDDEAVLDWDHEPKVTVGTDCYLAPEVALGGDNGRPADIWGLGCILLELLSGETLWDSEERLYDMALTGGSRKIDSVVEELLKCENAIKPPNVVKRLVKKMLHPDPEKRPSALSLMNLGVKKHTSWRRKG